jgi:predicted RNA polymerase sigma factor
MDDTATRPDERLELMFTCCHPALALEAHVALTLRTLGGLSTEEVATAFDSGAPCPVFMPTASRERASRGRRLT